jgi:hypothetical protein
MDPLDVSRYPDVYLAGVWNYCAPDVVCPIDLAGVLP